MENLNKQLVQVKSEVNYKETDLQELSELQLSIEDKAAHLSLQVNQVIIKPYLNQALDYLQNSRDEVMNSYNNLSSEIANEVEVLLETNRVLSLQVAEAKQTVSETQNLIRSRYSDATEFEIASGVLNLDVEYNKVAENYEKSMQLSQEIVKNRMRVESLLETQRLLDSSLTSRVSQIQVEIDNLKALLANLDGSYSGKASAELSGKFTHGEDLNRTVARLSEGLEQAHDASLYTHTHSSKVAADLNLLAAGEMAESVQSTVNVDDKDLFVVKKTRPVNLARLDREDK